MILLKKESKLSRCIEKFALSPYFMAIIGALTLCGHFLALDLYAYIVLGSLLILTVLFVEDGKPLLLFCCTLWPVVSNQNGATANGIYDYTYYSSKEMITMLIVMCSIAFCAFVLKFLVVKGPTRLFRKPSALTAGIIVFTIGLLTNGLDVYSWSQEMTAEGFSATYGITNLTMAGLLIFLWFGLFYYFRATIKWDKQTVDYLFSAVLTGGIVVLIQFAVRLITQLQAGELFYEGTFVIDRNKIDLGWGICNNIAAYLMLAVPATFYFATTRNHGWAYFLLTCVLMCAVILTQCRAAILVGLIVSAFGIVIMCAKAKSKRGVWLVTALVLGLLISVLVVFKDFFADAFPRLFATEVSSSGRFDIWKSGLDKFASAPLFGKGFSDDVTVLTNATIFHNLYHNEIVQILATCGVVGFAGFVLFKMQIIKVIFTRLTLNRLFLGITMLSVEMLSMFDSNIFFPFEAALFTACLAIAHFDYDDMKEKKATALESADNAEITTSL